MSKLVSPGCEDFVSALERHVIGPWFPRSLDLRTGGFLCDFDRKWEPCGPQHKLIEFQARHTLFAAEALRLYPDSGRLRQAAMHGYRCLRDTMWDDRLGGWYHLTDRAGEPLEAHTKHCHGFAYAIQACVAVHAVIPESDAISLAREGFAWMERHAHDAKHGGYFGFLTRDGEPVLGPDVCPWPGPCDTIGTEIGLKDLNVHSDLLETLVYLYRAWPDPTVARRLEEVLQVLTERLMVSDSGAIHHFATPDWQPVPHLLRVGTQFQTAFRLLLAAGVGIEPDRLRRLSRRIFDFALRHLSDTRGGGFVLAAPGAAPMSLAKRDLRVTIKSWWVQMEALKSLLAASREFPEIRDCRNAFEAQWRYIQRRFLDDRYAGVYTNAHDHPGRRQTPPRGRRPAGDDGTRKGDCWKDASHEGRALLYCIEPLPG